MIDPSSVDFVIYHANCSDGCGAAFAAWSLLGNRAEYFSAGHGLAPPDVTGKNVVCLDFAYNNETTKKMIEDANSFYIIDHHKSNMIELHDISNAHFNMEKSGAMLSWEFFHPGKEAPKFIKYIEDRDLWKFVLPYSKEFSAAFDMVPFDFVEYDKFCDDSVFDDAVKRGSYILAYSRTFIAKAAKLAVRRKLYGKEVLVVNSAHWINEIGEMLAKSADFALIWYYDHITKRYIGSLRSAREDIDVTEVAKHLGGGGHKKASGFQYEGKSIEDIFDSPDVVAIKNED